MVAARLRAVLAGWLGRSRRRWAMLAAIAALAAFYAAVAFVALNPRVDEAYRRTFITGEFSVHPRSPVFRPGDGLAYVPGAVVEVAEATGRRHLARFDWWRFASPKPWLRRPDGRVFLSVPAPLRRPETAHRLSLALDCAYPEGIATRLVFSVNGRSVGEALCGRGSVAFEAVLPPGLFPAGAYEELAIARPDLSLWERIATRLALRFEAVALDRFSVTPLD